MKRAIVTGGAGLIGAEICRDLSRNGWEVASFDLEAGPEDIRHLHCDVADEASVAAAFDALGWDRLDLLVNNAGIAHPHRGALADLTLAEWRRVTDSHLTRAALPLLCEGASIVNMASTRALMSEPDSEAYAAAKGGLVALTHALAVGLGPKVRVNAIAPGWIAGEEALDPEDHAQHPAGRVGRPQDVAQAVRYLVDAGFMTGQLLVLDGGMTRKMIYSE
jgi:NAD(P)-dependent dehydrogenase (short-subunit alcohol dehydrogenase family)